SRTGVGGNMATTNARSSFCAIWCAETQKVSICILYFRDDGARSGPDGSELGPRRVGSAQAGQRRLQKSNFVAPAPSGLAMPMQKMRKVPGKEVVVGPRAGSYHIWVIDSCAMEGPMVAIESSAAGRK